MSNKATGTRRAGLEETRGCAAKRIGRVGSGAASAWSYAEIRAKKFDSAVNVLEKALAIRPDDEQLVNQLAYAVDQWTREASASEGSEKAEAILADLLKRYSKYDDVKEAARSYFLPRR